MGYSSVDDVYSIPALARILHSLPHLNVTFYRVNNTFDYKSPVYLESLGILGSIPAAWLILTLLVLLIYLLTRCCDRKPRPLKSISALKITLAVVSVLCCAAIGLGLYGNDDLHNGISQFLAEGKQVDQLFARIRNHTDAIERQLRIQANSQITQIKDILDESVTNVVNVTAKKQIIDWINMASGNNSLAANAAADIRRPLQSIHIAEKVVKGEYIEAIRWPTTMALLSILLMLCVVLLVGVARHNRCALIAFSVCGLLAVIASYVMASLYLATTVALADLCMAPDKFLQEQASTEVTKEILHYYTSCERARANPFTQRQREGKAAIQNMRTVLDYLKKPAIEMYPRKGLDHKFSSLLNQVKEGDMLMTSLISLVDCKALYTHYLRGARALCNVGLLGLSLMLASAVLAGLLLTALVWIDSHTWIYIRKRKDYHQVNETESFLPASAASQAIAARTLQRSQGSSFPPDTPPPSYTSAMMHNYLLEPSAPMHEAQTLISSIQQLCTMIAYPLRYSDGCDMRSAEHPGGRGGGERAHMSHLRGHTLGRLPSHHHEPLSGPNNGKYATLSKQCKTLESSDFY
ncbi:tweety-related [Holotrichia oblita]|uniref:Tweety-related n=1 Tax=Holotrichia oblita TaxID=644536 RepID=A0ACB9SUR3_HOLOL|nr:tweety-related [Holotrichia oblita]